MNHIFTSIALFLSLCVLIGFSPKPESTTRTYAFSYLVLDEPDLLDEKTLAAAMTGHFSNMDVLAEEGKLLIAGPLADPRINESYRGIYVFDVDTADKGMELFQTDPSVQARVFKPEMYMMECTEPLFDLPRLEKEDEAARLLNPDIPDQWEGRLYVLAIAPGHTSYEQTDSVLINAIMTPIQTDENAKEIQSSRLLFLDFETVDDARNGFIADDIDAWSFYGWYGSKMVAKLHKD